MKNIGLLLLIFLVQTAAGQQARRGNFAIVPSLGINMTVLQPGVVNQEGPYVLRRESVENPECYDDHGNLVDCDQRNYHAGIGAMYRLNNKSGTGGWMVMGSVGYRQQTYTLNYPENRKFRIPVNCTPSIMRLLRATTAEFSLAKYWDTGDSPRGMQVIARMGVMVAGHFKYKRGSAVVTLPDTRPLNYISYGNGTIISMSENVPRYNVLLTPEIGLQEKNFPVELAISAHIPIVNAVVYSEVHTFAENNYVAGKNRVDYTNAVVNLTARYRFDFKTRPRKVKQPKGNAEYRAPSASRIHSEPEKDNSRFARIAMKEPTRLNVFFDLEKADLRRSSFAELDELAQWMQRYPNVRIRLEGHTDLIGDASANKQLSQQRVEEVKKYLVNLGVSSPRIEVKGFGESRPISRDCPPPNYCPENRRVEMVILKR